MKDNSLMKPIPEWIYSAMDESQRLFFLTVGFNFCIRLTKDYLFGAIPHSKEASGNE